jgi:molecular chaperone DnaK
MKAEAAANADADKKAKEEADKVNSADQMIFQTEKQLKEYGDKVPADAKAKIEEILAQLKTAHASRDIAGIDAAMKEINDLWQQASQHMYSQPNNEGGNAGANANAGGGGNESGNVQDVEAEEVK